MTAGCRAAKLRGVFLASGLAGITGQKLLLRLQASGQKGMT